MACASQRPPSARMPLHGAIACAPPPARHVSRCLWTARRLRSRYPAVLWAVLVFGGIITVSFTYLFGLENTWSHRLMVAAVAGLIALVLFTVGSLEYPFSGGTRVGPEAFELVLRRFESSALVKPR